MPELIDVLTMPFSPKIKPCPICNNPPEILRFDESDDFTRVMYEIRCKPHQFKCSPMLLTPMHSDLDLVVQSWNRRVEAVISEQGKINSSHSRDVQSFEDVSHKDFLNFLEEGGSDG